jgi:hypothetical protein
MSDLPGSDIAALACAYCGDCTHDAATCLECCPDPPAVPPICSDDRCRAEIICTDTGCEEAAEASLCNDSSCPQGVCVAEECDPSVSIPWGDWTCQDEQCNSWAGLGLGVSHGYPYSSERATLVSHPQTDCLPFC